MIERKATIMVIMGISLRPRNWTFYAGNEAFLYPRNVHTQSIIVRQQFSIVINNRIIKFNLALDIEVLEVRNSLNRCRTHRQQDLGIRSKLFALQKKITH